MSRAILVRAPNWIGDQVMAFPFFYALRRAYPRSRIGVICADWVKDLMFRGEVDEVFVLPRSYRGSLREKFGCLEEAARTLREAGPWDLGISLPNSFSSAWLLWRAGVKQRRGYRTEGRGFLLNDGRAWDESPGRHRGQAYLDLLDERPKAIGEAIKFWGTPPENNLDPGIPGVIPRFADEKEWPGFARHAASTEPYWVLAPGATADSRRWPPEFFIQLGRQIYDSLGLRGWIVGGPKEAPLAEILMRESKQVFKDMTAQGPVPGLAQIFANARFTVTNESGLAHVASLHGSFVQIVCGAADPRRTRPLGPGRVQVAVNPVECWPCEKNTCSQPAERQFQCLRGISPQLVFEEIQRGLRAGS